jgi:hypothetical protein
MHCPDVKASHEKETVADGRQLKSHPAIALGNTSRHFGTNLPSKRQRGIDDLAKIENSHVTIRILEEFGFAVLEMNLDCAGSQSSDR